MRVQTDRLLSITAYFACGSMVRFCLFPENLALRAKFSGKRMFHSTLPEANRAGCPGRRLVWNRLRNSCNMTIRGIANCIGQFHNGHTTLFAQSTQLFAKSLHRQLLIRWKRRFSGMCRRYSSTYSSGVDDTNSSTDTPYSLAKAATSTASTRRSPDSHFET